MSIRTRFAQAKGRWIATAGALLAVPALLTVGLAGAASAAPTHPAVPPQNKIVLAYNGHLYTYAVNLHTQQIGPWFDHEALVTGTLRDNYEPQHLTLNVLGVDFNGKVVISVAYPTAGPDAGNQGVRTFSLNAGPGGHFNGKWSETGSENGSGAASLLRI